MVTNRREMESSVATSLNSIKATLAPGLKINANPKPCIKAQDIRYLQNVSPVALQTNKTQKKWIRWIGIQRGNKGAAAWKEA